MVVHARVITGAGGGPDKTILNSPRFLRSFGYDGTCVYLRLPNDSGFQSIRERANAADCGIREIDDRGPFDTGIVSRAIAICRELDAKVWHAHDYKTNLLGLIVCRSFPMKLVTTVHGWVEYTFRTRLYYLLDRLMLPRYQHVICVSSDLHDTCNKSVRSDRISLIENAIDTDQFQRRVAPREKRNALAIADTDILIGAVGRLSAEKGFDVLIRAFDEIRKQIESVRLVILGDGPERNSLQQLIDSLNLNDRVQLVRFQSDTRDWFEAMDIFALSSLREGLPNVVLEAMAMETPVVVTAVAGVPDLVQDQTNGYVVPVGDLQVLANAIMQLIRQPKLRKEFAQQARRDIESRYSFDLRMKKVAAIYDSLLRE